MTRRSAADPRQLLLSGLFEYPKAPEENPGSLNFALELRGVLSNALKKCTPSRYEVAARMSELLGIEVTKYHSTPGRRKALRLAVPFEYAAAFEWRRDDGAADLLARKRAPRPGRRRGVRRSGQPRAQRSADRIGSGC
jgi:hypothetical protein